MVDICRLLWFALIGLFRSRASLEVEILALRHQLAVLQRKVPAKPAFRNADRLIFSLLYRLAPSSLNALTIVRPETVIRWHRAGFRAWWRWKSRPRGGRPRTPLEIRRLIRAISLANPLWGAPRIHGELLKLGIDVGQTTVAKYMARRRGPPSQGWKTFLRNHADGIAAMDLFVVPTMSFRLLFGLLILRHDRREIVWLGVTGHPTAEWIARQLTEAFGWEHGTSVSAARSGPGLWQCICPTCPGHGHPGSAHCGDGHHGRMDIARGRSARSGGTALTMSSCLASAICAICFKCYADYYNQSRTHLSLDKDAPTRRQIQRVGRIAPTPVLGGLHHRYVRI